MRWSALTVVALAACGGGSAVGRGAASPSLSGDLCTLHEDATSCRADSRGCLWYPDTRACPVGATCPAGWCSTLASDGGAADGGISGSAGCACPGANGDVCVTEIGGPAVREPPAITCQAVPASCSHPDRCACLATPTLGPCRSSDQVTNLCVCDNGIR